jgi:hypothetical protein
MDEDKTNFDPEIYFAGITDPEGRARTRLELHGSGPEAQLNMAIYRADREPLGGTQPSFEYPVAMSLPQDENIYEVDFGKFDPRFPRPHFRHQSHAYFERRIAEIEAEGKLRPAILNREVVKAYRAISYCNWQFGTLLNCFLTVSYDALGLFDHREAMQVHSALNKKIGNLLKGSTVGAPRRRFHRTPMSRLNSCPHTYIWVVENTRDKGFHVHQLMHVPATTIRISGGQFVRASTVIKKLIAQWFADRFELPKVSNDAIVVTDYARKSETHNVDKQWERFRYIMKTASPELEYKMEDGPLRSGRKIFTLPHFVRSRQIYCAQMLGVSHNISKDAQDKSHFISAFDEYKDEELYTGWELEAYRARIEDLRAKSEYEELIKTLNI